ncbi:rluC [Symbiodinium natans]|uniref:RluC protein n=1 Tax=Symbiodinium natans TaxID=878477 RepID=A0A812KZQ8_9DINO|nr:rluC [Symbiodinium natans]
MQQQEIMTSEDLQGDAAGLAAALGKHGVPPDPCSAVIPSFAPAMAQRPQSLEVPPPPRATLRPPSPPNPPNPPMPPNPSPGHAAPASNKPCDPRHRRLGLKEPGPARFYGTTPQPGSTYSLPVLQHPGAFAQEPRPSHLSMMKGFVSAVDQSWPPAHLQGLLAQHVQARPRLHQGPALQDVRLPWSRVQQQGCMLPNRHQPWQPSGPDFQQMLPQLGALEGCRVPRVPDGNLWPSMSHLLGSAGSMGSERSQGAQGVTPAGALPQLQPQGLNDPRGPHCGHKAALPVSTPPGTRPPVAHQAYPVAAQDLEAFLASKAACTGDDAQVPDQTKTSSSDKNDSGRRLLMLLKGRSCEREGALPEVTDERCHKSRWEQLLQPFPDSSDPKAPEEAETSSSNANDNSGRLLLMLLKGSKGEGAGRPASEASALSHILQGALPEVTDERWHRSRWEPLLQPFADSSDPKRFICAEHFAPGRGLCVSGSGAQPCVLQDLPCSDLLVMYKPSGWATCSTPQWEGVHGNLIRYVWKKHSSGPVAAPCHRLDRGTSGIVIVAKSRTALRHVCLQISGRTLVKQYIGLCRGIVDPPQGALSIPLAISSADKPLGACATAGRVAVTRYRVLGYFRQQTSAGSTEYSLVQVQIDHGRQHQIRLHMASVGHPIVCDVKYSSSHFKEDSQVTGGRLFLHAAFLRGTLPPDGVAPLHIACRLPRHLRECLTSMERLRSMEETLSGEDASPVLLGTASFPALHITSPPFIATAGH